MANYDDYQLDEMENAAVDKSKNLKRGLVAGAAVLGVGGTAAFGASQYINSQDQEDSDLELTTDDLLAGANSATDDVPQEEAQTQQAPAPQEVHVNHHVVQEPISQPIVSPDPVVSVDETAVLLDENGEVVSVYDRGTVDGMDFIAIDSDLNGKADILAIDENMNGIIEDNEIHQIDNETYVVGQGQNMAVYGKTTDGEIVKIYDEPNHPDVAYVDDNEPIHNDFDDERTGEEYHGDLADNNSDYNNEGGSQYSASAEEYDAVENDYMAQTEEYGAEDYNGSEDSYAYNEPAVEEYGYEEPGNDMASFENTESFDDVTFDA